MNLRSINYQVVYILILILVCTGCQNITETPFKETIEPAKNVISPAGLTYYIRMDGGTAEQCDGLSDTPYPGAGLNQPCAWNHPFHALPPGSSARIAGGDTLIIGDGSYQMGYGAPGSETCDYESSYDCHLSAIPSGADFDHPTRVLGAGWDKGCADAPELWGTGRPWMILNLTDSSNVQIACLEVTDHSSCIEDHLDSNGGSIYTCQRERPPYGDWADTGLFAEDSENVWLKDLYIHGLANNGVLAGRLTDWTVENLQVSGNGWVGWNGDIEGEDANRGTLAFRNWQVEWNGCGETYPEKEHLGCWGQEAGGYGDGVGTGTTGGHWIIEDSIFRNNTSDGLDLYYARLPDAVIDIRRTLASGNGGNQIKITASNASIENTIIVSNCGYFNDFPYWNEDDSCRAAGDGLVLAIQPGGKFDVVNSTLTGEGVCLMIAECALDKTCTGNEQIRVINTLFQGQKSFFYPQEDVSFAWYDYESMPPMVKNPFMVSYSVITDVRFGNVTPCPGDNNLCAVQAGLADQSLYSFDAHLLEGSPAINAGLGDLAPMLDFQNLLRDETPDIGAFEWFPGSY